MITSDKLFVIAMVCFANAITETAPLVVFGLVAFVGYLILKPAS